MLRVEKALLSPYAYEEFHQELLSQIDIGEPLKAILENKTHYYIITCKNIRFSYIPVKTVTQKRMKRLMHRLIDIATIFNITHQINYWFLLCDMPRSFPSHGELFETKHINGAYTYTTTKDVYVYRLDDFEKVAIHELLHASILDFGTLSTDKQLQEAFGIDGNTYANEAVIEAWAIMLYLSEVSNTEELKRGLSLSHRLLLYNMPVWKEKTPAYAYIRLRTCIMYYWKKFCKISYPYDEQELTKFLIEHNTKPSFLKKIRATPPTASLNMTLKWAI